MVNRYQGVVERIQRLSDEQHRLYLTAAKQELSASQRKRLAEIKQELQTLWLNRKRERTHMHDPLDEFVDQWYKKAA
ncbi:MAG: DUF2630 family protein [Chloroflexi bacterium]|nr:DUF2630 family protein [Chloroflexota bacterium]